MYFDAYATGKHTGFEGSECYLLGCCGMTGFACMEPITHASATTFASAIMKILLRYGFCHMAVLDKDAKFVGVYSEALYLLQINRHVLSSANHNPMLVERVNCYVTKGLKIICNDFTIALCMELLPSAWDRHFLQSCCRRQRVCIPYPLLQWELLGIKIIMYHSSVLLKGTCDVFVCMPRSC